MDYFSEGNKLYNNQDYKRAIDFYKKSVQENSKEACSYYNAGVCFIKLKDYDNAITMLKKAISINGESKYYFNLGYCYAMKDITNKALLYFNLAWAKNNDDEDCEKAIKLITHKIKKSSK